MYVLIALAAAVAFALSSVLKHASARSIDSAIARHGGLRRLGALAVRSARHRLWLAAIGADVIAVALQIVALHLGPLTVVQPVLATALLIALLVEARGRLRVRVWVWALVLAGAIATVARLTGATPPGTGADRTPAIVGGALVLLVVVACIVAAGRAGVGVSRALALAAGVGVLYAVNAALLKVIADHAATDGIVGVFTTWPTYVVVVGGAAGLLLNQAAFQAGTLSQSLPAMAVADPLCSVVIGLAVFDEPLLGGPLGTAAVVVSTGLLCLSIAGLARSASMPSTSSPTALDDAQLTGCST